MKLPEAFTQIFQKKPEKGEVYLSLVLEESAVQVALWSVLSVNIPHISEAISERVTDNAWDKRLEACDRAIARLVEKEGRDDFEKVVLGLPTSYLTTEDDVDHTVRPHIKTLTHELELTAIGFVPIHQAIAHQIRQEEGVPPSVILIEADSQGSTLILYRVGVMVGKVKIGNDDFVANLEKTLKGFKDIEVLPSRILLYGGDTALLEASKRDLLKHPWPTRANFLHYPKIDVLPLISLASAVSLAGASELATQVSSSTEQPVGEVVAVEDADANVTEVSPETLGFRHDVDIVERPIREQENDLKNDEKPYYVPKKRIQLPSFETIMHGASMIKVPSMGLLVFLALFLLVAGGGWFLYWVLPKAQIVLYQVPYTITEVSAVSINPTATVVDAATKIVPGRKQERTVMGDKTIAVIGKKDIGDPAKGTVTIYNKTLTGKQLKKGIILTAGSLSFTLDSDVSIASASESLASGSVTYGKANTAISAVKLGPQSNLPGSTEFAVRDTPTSVMIARNDVALSGGTSKAVTVVSRDDYDALVTDLTRDLIAKAKAELSSNVAGGEQLIDETVSTAVSQKKFDQELDQESDKLHGSISVSISGISYNAVEVASLFADIVSGKVPSGYILDKNSGTVSVSNVQVKKDGSVFLNARYQGAATPKFDFAAMKSAIARKSTSTAEQYFRNISGVGGIEMNIERSFWKTTFPINPNNILFTIKNLE
ncbi:MAG: hypothetical protein AAB481_04625 [Patescibacteria group bacterium]